jgi:hypothetical protein
MRLIAEYLEHARHFERMAAQERNLRRRGALKRQAAAYRRLAEMRAKHLGLSIPARDDRADALARKRQFA